MSQKKKEIITAAVVCIVIALVVFFYNYEKPADSDYSTTLGKGKNTLTVTYKYPTPYIEIERNGKYTTVEDDLASFYIIDRESGKIRQTYGGMLIQVPADLPSVKHTSRVTLDEGGNTIRFSVIPCGEDISDVKVLRWPVELFGCENPLEAAEVIPYTTEKATRRRDKDKSYFTAEKGYLYSVYITWDEYYAEYSFIAE